MLKLTARTPSSPRLTRLAALVCASALALTACGGETEDVDSGTADTGNGGGADAGTPPDRAVYPAGPYGGNVQQILPDLTFTAGDGSAVSFSSIRSDASKQYLFINTAAFWCGACIEEQPEVAAIHNDFSDRGLVTLVTVFEDASAEPATPEDAARWESNYNLPFPVVADTDASLGAFYDTALTPLNMLVELSTMTVVYRSTGNDIETIRTTLDLLLD